MKLARGIITAVLTASLSLSCTVFADGGTVKSVYYDAVTECVTYSVGLTAEVASLVVTPVSDSSTITYIDHIFGTGTEFADDFTMPDNSPSDQYKISIVYYNEETDANTEEVLYFYHINDAAAQPIVDQIRTKTTSAEIEQLVSNNLATLAIDAVYFTANGTAVSDKLLAMNKPTLTANEFYKNYQYAKLLTDVTGKTAAVISTTLADNAGLLGLTETEKTGFKETDKTKGAFKDAVKTAMASRLNTGAVPAGDFVATVKDWIALARLNAAESVTEYQNLLFTEYSGIITLEDTALSKYNASNYKDLIITDMMAVDYADKAALVSAFTSNAEKDRQQGSDNGGAPSGDGSGSGGGGGGGGASGGETGPTIPIELPKPSPSLNDIGGHWAEEIIKDLFDNKVVSGSDNKFYPNNNITRAEFCTLIARAFYNGQEGATSSFVDVNKDNWYYSYVGLLNSKGIVSGMGDGTFGAGRNITRQDMAAIIARCMNDLKKNTTPTRDMAEFTDASAIADYSKDAVELLYRAGIISGYEDGSFNPKANLTKAEAATVIHKLINK